MGQLPAGADQPARRCRRRRCAPATSASCSGANTFFSSPADHPRSGDRPAVPRATSSRQTAERQRPGAAQRVSAADGGIPVRHQQRDHQQPEPAGPAQGQHPVRLPAEREQHSSPTATASTTGRRSTRSAARSRSRAPTGIGPTPRRRRAGRARSRNNLDQRGELHLLARPGVHQRLPERSLQAQQLRHHLSLHLSRRTRRSRTRSRPSRSPNFTEIDGGPYPSSSQGPIHTFSDATTWVKNRHTFKGGVSFEYSGEDDFDQINVQPIPGSTNNQNGRFQFTNSGFGAHRARRSRTRRWGCSRTTPRSASAR